MKLVDMSLEYHYNVLLPTMESPMIFVINRDAIAMTFGYIGACFMMVF